MNGSPYSNTTFQVAHKYYQCHSTDNVVTNTSTIGISTNSSVVKGGQIESNNVQLQVKYTMLADEEG